MTEIFGRTFEALAVRRDGDLLWVTLDNPNKANALSPAMVDEITALYGHPLRAEGIRAVLLRGAGKHFSAGADLAYLESLRDAGPDENRADSTRLRNLFASILRQDALTIALVHGSCVAGGCGLATANDYVVASDDARFLYSEVKIGFVAALVATYLPLRVKGRDLRELLLDPQMIDAHKALEIGLINRVVAAAKPTANDDDAGDCVLARAGERLAAGILGRASSESIARTKRLLLDVVGMRLDNAMDHAAQANAEARATDDCRHGISTFLATKKAPRWRPQS